MFGFLFRKAQATVDNAISQLLWGLLIAVPLLVGAGFATAALSGYLHKLYEPESANLILAAGFAAIGSLVAIIYAARSGPPPVDSPAEEAETTDETAVGFSETDREAVMAALSAAAPMALPPVLRSLFRNLPIVLVIAVAAFILSQTGREESAAEAPAAAE